MRDTKSNCQLSPVLPQFRRHYAGSEQGGCEPPDPARGQDYADAGEDYYDQHDQRNREHLIRHHRQALARLGCQVTLVPPRDDTPPPGTARPPLGQAA